MNSQIAFCNDANARISLLLMELPFFRSICMPVGSPLGIIELLFDPSLESNDVLARWAAFRRIAPFEELANTSFTTRERLLSLVTRNMVRFGNAPPLASFKTFSPNAVSSEFLRTWLSWHGIQAPSEEANDARDWLEKTVRIRKRSQISCRALPVSPTQAVSQLHRARRTRDRALATIRQLGDCALEPMNPRVFSAVESHLYTPLKEVERREPNPELLDFAAGGQSVSKKPSTTCHLLQALAMLAGGKFLDYQITKVMDDRIIVLADSVTQQRAVLATRQAKSSFSMSTAGSFTKFKMLETQLAAYRATKRIPLIMYTNSAFSIVAALGSTKPGESTWNALEPWMRNNAPAIYAYLARAVKERTSLGIQTVTPLLTFAFEDIIRKTLYSKEGMGLYSIPDVAVPP